MMMRIQLIFLAAGLLFCLNLSAQQRLQENELLLMPFPAQLALQPGRFDLEKGFAVSVEGETHERIYAGATRFLRRLDGRTGLFFPQQFVEEGSPGVAGGLLIRIRRPAKLELNEDESYQLRVTEESIQLVAETDLGALRGLETLLQLLQADSSGYYFPAVEIQDQPRFPWRGLMIDVARHFQPVEVIKRNIDGMAAVKMNVLHLHLSDDQGFRMESVTYPRLHQKASEGRYFSRQEMREIIRYAADRGIRVVPEFDVPGHASSWLVAFPELASAPGPYQLEEHAGIFDPTLNPANEQTYTVLQRFFAEMAALFPDPYFHIGGDENEGKHWDANPQIQAFMKKHQLPDNHALQGYFNKRIIGFLEEEGKKAIGWDEILQPGLPETAVIQSWRGKEGLAEAARKGYATLLSNGFYIDLMKPAGEHYLNDPLPEGHGLSREEQKLILGGEATMWSELVVPHSIDSRIWPRTAAIAERLWSPASLRDVDDMYRRLSEISFRLEELGLQHIRNQQVLLRNLSNGQPIGPLQTLIEVVEPLKGYTRNPGGTLYTMYSPYTLWADAATADAPAARAFTLLVEEYLQEEKADSRQALLEWLRKWEKNHSLLKPMMKNSPVLKDIEDLSKNLSLIAGIGRKALEASPPTGRAGEKSDFYQQAMQQLEEARRQGGRTELQVVDGIEKLLKASIGMGSGSPGSY